MLGAAFSATALFCLGVRMVGKVSQLQGADMLLPVILVTVKMWVALFISVYQGYISALLFQCITDTSLHYYFILSFIVNNLTVKMWVALFKTI